MQIKHVYFLGLKYYRFMIRFFPCKNLARDREGEREDDGKER